jgi:DNA uptake protein ComE-like DNA-binding protein
VGDGRFEGRAHKTSRAMKQFQSHLSSDPYHRFRSVAEVQRAAQLGVRVDVNRAGVDDWLRLPGLSIHQAQLLTQLSQQGVQFVCIEDLAAVLDLPIHRLMPLAPILQFCYYDTHSLDKPHRVDSNRDGYEQLAAIPGMSDALARMIVRDRLLHGPYQHLADLQQRLNLSPKQTQRLMQYLRF